MIETPFGPQRIFDAHAHFLSHSFMAKLGAVAGLSDDTARGVCEKLGWEVPPEDPAGLARLWIDELDAHGVDRSVLFHTAPGDPACLAEAASAFPDRLVAYLMVNPTEPSCMPQLARAVDEWGFRGITLFPAMHRFDLASPPAQEVLRFADQKRLAVFVHCGVLKVGFRKALGIACPFDGTMSNPLALQPHAASFAGANFVIPHLGSGLLRELLMLADACPNVYTDTSGMAGWARYLPGRVSEQDCLGQVLDCMSPRRVLFGSDSSFFPRGWRKDVFEQQMALFRKVGLTRDDLAMVLGGNLTAILDDAQ